MKALIKQKHWRRANCGNISPTPSTSIFCPFLVRVTQTPCGCITVLLKSDEWQCLKKLLAVSPTCHCWKQENVSIKQKCSGLSVWSAEDYHAFTLQSLIKILLPVNTVFNALYRGMPPSMLIRTKTPVKLADQRWSQLHFAWIRTINTEARHVLKEEIIGRSDTEIRALLRLMAFKLCCP